MVLVVPFLYCPVRDVIWTDLWYVIGTGILKTSDTTLTIDYRGATITLPNTGPIKRRIKGTNGLPYCRDSCSVKSLR